MSITVRFDPTANSQQAQIIGDATINSDGVMTAAQVQQLDAATAASSDPAALIPDASLTTAGLMTPEQVQQLDAAIAEEDVFIYASTTGNDANDGLTPATAVATLTQAVNLLPASWKKSAQIIIAPGAYTWDNFSLGGDGWRAGGAVGPAGVGLVFLGSFTNEYGDLIDSGGSNGDTVTLPVTPAVTLNEQRGGFIECISGANAGQRRMITKNTVGAGPGPVTFTVNSPFANPIVAGVDVFRIEQPAVTINAANFFAPANNYSMGFLGIKIVNAFFMAWPANFVALSGCQIDLNGGFMEINGTFEATSFPIFFGLFNPLNPFSFDAFPTGVYIKNGFAEVTGEFGGGGMIGHYVIDNVTFTAGDPVSIPNFNQHARYMLRNPSCTGTTLVSTAGTIDILGGETNGLVTIRAEFDGSSTGDNTINVSQNAVLSIIGTDISNSQGNAIDVQSGAVATVGDVGGTLNTGAGLHAGHAGTIIFDDGGSPTTVTGAVDTLVGVTPQTYAALAVNANQFDGFGNRITPVSAP